MVALLSFVAISSFATIHVIRVTNYQFSPKTVNARINDTIVWIWKDGTHTTTSTQIPQGATPWDAPITQTNRRFGMIVSAAGVYNYKCKPHASSGMTGKINVSAAKPAAGMYGFSLVPLAATTELKWNSNYASGINSFVIKRSLDGAGFTEIARIQPAGKIYSYADKSPVKSKFVYYMVEALYIDGSTQYSEIKMAERAASAKLITAISPNPVTKAGHLMLTFNAEKDGEMTVKLFTASGSILKQANMHAVKGVNSGHIHFNNIKPGTYYMQCTLGSLSEKHTVIFQ